MNPSFSQQQALGVAPIQPTGTGGNGISISASGVTVLVNTGVWVSPRPSAMPTSTPANAASNGALTGGKLAAAIVVPIVAIIAIAVASYYLFYKGMWHRCCGGSEGKPALLVDQSASQQGHGSSNPLNKALINGDNA